MAVSLINEATEKVLSVYDAEQDALDNLPENLQYSDRYASMEGAVDSLDDARQSLEDAVSGIMDAIGS